MASNAKILLFHVKPEKTKQIESVCRSLKLQPVKIKPSSYKQKLGYLAGIKGFNRENTVYQGPDFPAEMLVFSGMDSNMVDTFLAKCREAFIPPINLKAVLTPHNVSWSAEILYKELLKEHLRFSQNNNK
ncbi:MAG: DUF3783 domain-containing protein [Lachnospiraceae bacterium]|nr:DUF3783 domain-containing protein [Lachnospiraceae bacterium]